jgi:outer membrane protein assembly factor BamB
MAGAISWRGSDGRKATVVCLILCHLIAAATDWPQYRGPTHDGITPDPINWPSNGPMVVWTNMTLTNGFSTFVVSQGRVFTVISRKNASGTLLEYCVGVDAATGVNLWATPIGVELWDPGFTGDGGAGIAPYWKGDGPRTTPSVSGGRVVAASEQLDLVCMNATDGSVLWSNNLFAAFGASSIPWDNASSPAIDNDLVFVNLNSATNNQTLTAFRLADGSLAWSTQFERVTHATPVVATIDGVRQVIFATQTGLISLNPSTGAYLWKYSYPFGQIYTSMGASPVVYSNIVYCTAGYFKGAAAARVTLTNSAWSVTQLYHKTTSTHRSIWMSPVCYQGFVYSLAGENSTYLSAPLNCIDLTTGELKWTTNNFGMGGLILVNTNLLILTEDAQLILADPNPNAYTERARVRAFHISASTPGKCWNNPIYSNGRIYARSTIGGICLDVSATSIFSPLKFFVPRVLNSTQLELFVGTADGTPLDSSRLQGIEVRAMNNLTVPFSDWPKLTNALELTPNGLGRLTTTIAPGEVRRFYRAVEQR